LISAEFTDLLLSPLPVLRERARVRVLLPLPLRERAGVRGNRGAFDGVVSQLYFRRFPLTLTLSRGGERGPEKTLTPALSRSTGRG